MQPKSLRFASFLVALAALTWPGAALAKKKKAEPPADTVELKEEPEKKPAEEKPAEEAPAEASDQGEKKDDAAPKDAAPADEGAGKRSLVEEKDKSYYTVGLRFRGLFIPKFMIEAF